jgi:SpoVK/Ycf46/Vps4 family AAA+-type ATPase
MLSPFSALRLTSVVELVCEHLQRPLYIASGGELGTTAETVDLSLRTLLELSFTWNAVVLIDEADVFLEERSYHDVQRNSLVSIFLRHLEYFQGILFLTTNRVNSFDSAFTSRIHLSLYYPALSADIRQGIWRKAILRIPVEDRDIDFEKDLEYLKGFEVNGRVVTYTVRAAVSIAKLDGVKLTVKHISDVLEITESFQKVISQGKGASLK